MKKMQILTAFVVSGLFLLTACEKYPLNTGADFSNKLETRSSVVPAVTDPWFPGGDAAGECQRAGDCMGFALKVDNWSSAGEDGTYSDANAQPGTSAANEIVVYNSDGYSFSWSSTYEVCKIIVKGGTGANIYYYPEGSCADENLVAPPNTNSPDPNDTKAISHATFCWSNTLCEAPPAPCYQEETAWSSGVRYVKKGNWATYTAYAGNPMSVTIYAGQTIPAGTAIFSAPASGMVTITINLSPNFIFYYDQSDLVADYNIKIQDYGAGGPPAKNPAPGQFAWKSTALFGSHSASVVVPMASYYGIHLDVAYETVCK